MVTVPPRVPAVGCHAPILRAVVELVEPALEAMAVNPPDAAAADLDGGEVTASHEGVDLRLAHVEQRRYVARGQEPRLHAHIVRHVVHDTGALRHISL